MTIFLAQTINNKIVHDFVFELERSIEYQNWRDNHDFQIQFCEIDKLIQTIAKLKNDNVNLVPVGTVEFFMKFCEIYFNKDVLTLIKPLNIPLNLMQFAKREIYNIRITDERNEILWSELMGISNDENKLFIKSNDIIKSEYNGIYSVKDIMHNFPNGIYQISEIIEIESEYRCFIYNGQLLGIQYYNGNFKIFPNIETVDNIAKYFSNNSAYTFDVGVNSKGETFLIECHDFFSCGLYGFNDYNKLPYMFSRTFNYLKQKINNS